MNEIEIVPYEPSLLPHFIALNREWLEKYFVVEPHDQEVFEQAESLIIEPGGMIFFCSVEGQIVGTVALQKTDDRTFELAKMAVTPAFQGKGHSKLLMEACIAFAREKQCRKLVLQSNRRLETALTLYRRFGFVEVPITSTEYARADIQMELDLQPTQQP